MISCASTYDTAGLDPAFLHEKPLVVAQSMILNLCLAPAIAERPLQVQSV